MAILTASAICQCSCGLTPIPLNIAFKTVKAGGKLIATINDNSKINIPSFGMCTSKANPMVIAAQAAGSPEAPCIPMIITSWTTDKPTVHVCGKPVCTNSSTCSCQYCGTISVVIPAQFSVK